MNVLICTPNERAVTANKYNAPYIRSHKVTHPKDGDTFN